MVSSLALGQFLKKHKQVGLDSNILIYFIEGSKTYEKPVKKVFEFIESGKTLGVCATLSLLEILVQPYRNKNEELVNQFYGMLTTYPHLTWVDMGIEIADMGAQLRAKYNLKTPDSILLATAIHSRATGFIGNDAKFKKVTELDVLMLS